MLLPKSTRTSLRVPSRPRLLSHASITRAQTRPLSSQARPPSRHAQFYTDYAAGMIPVALLGSAVYIGLRTWQQHLAHERFLDEARAHVQQLEAEVTALRQQQQQLQQSPEVAQDMSSQSKKRSGWLPW